MNTGVQRRSYECAPVAADVKADRIARELKIFLEKAPSQRFGHSPRKRLPISLDDVLAPALTFAITELQRIAPGAAENILAQSAWEDLRRDLSARLALAVTPTLRLQQNTAKAVARSMETVAQDKRPSRTLGPAITLLETVNEFPGLLETAARLISAWIDAQRELLARLLCDRAEVCSIFLRGRQRFRATHVRARLSDPHDGARTATMIEFGERRCVVYKPRPADREELWFEALRWLSQNGTHASFRVPKMLARKRYVWMEFLRTKSCKSLDDVRILYFRWGIQAALAQILGATDLHRENWLAVGSQPILVDAELIGDAAPPSVRSGKKSLDRQSLPALLKTGLLPFSSRDRVGFYRGIAPLDATILETALPSCWPRYQRAIQRPSRYVNDLVRGFKMVTRVLATPGLARKFFRKIILPNKNLRNQRVLLRATAQYVRLLRESFEARNMISAGGRWQHLARECCLSAPDRRVGLAEASALLRCDIPKFTIRRSAIPPSWKRFSAAVAELKSSSQLLRGRVLLGRHRS